MQVGRARFLAGVGASGAAGVVRFPAGAAEFSYKLALDVPISQSVGARALEAAARILRDSGGRFEIKVFPNSVLGGDKQLLDQMRLGAIEFDCVPTDVLGDAVAAAGMPGLPFLVATRKDALNMLSGTFGAYVRGALAKVGIYQFPRSWDGDFRDVENNVRPISTPADMRGLKIRIQDSPINLALFKALGATPTVTSGAEMYTGLQTHILDGVAVPVVVLETFKLYEVTKYVSYTHHSWNSFTMVANGDAWNRLPKDLQDIASRNFETARVLNNDDYVKNDQGVEQRMKAHGLLFNNADAAAFRKTVRDAGLYANWKTLYPPEAWALLEKSVGTLG